MPASALNPGARVRIAGLKSRADLNGKQAVVKNGTMNGRFVCTVDGTSEQISLKPANLELLASAPAPGQGWAGRAAEVQRQVQETLDRVQAMLPPGTNPTVVLGGAALLVGLFAFMFGLVRTALLVSVLIFAVRNGADDFKTGGAKAAANAIGTKVSRKVLSVTGFTLAPMQALGLVVVVLLLLMRITGGGGGGGTPPSDRSSPRGYDSTVGVDDEIDDEDPLIFGMNNPTYSWDEMEAAYKAGFEDANNEDTTFETSLPAMKKKASKKAKKKKKKRRRAMGEDDDFGMPSSYGGGGSGGGGGGGGGGFGMMQIFTLGMIGKTVYDLGNTAAGWDQSTFLMNLQTMPKWRLALNAFLILRLVGMSPI
jgi:hypothetical protein